jgi:5-methylcytosine-specific restriction endonuclease McrA
MAYKDPERQRAYAREWMRRHPERAREAMRRWRDAHREVSRARNREYKRALYARDPEGQKARIAAYYADHPEALRAKDHRYRARRRDAQGHFTAVEWMDLVTQFGGVCGYCRGPGPLQADHRIPLCRGGTNSSRTSFPRAPGATNARAETPRRNSAIALHASRFSDRLNSRIECLRGWVAQW